MFGIMGISAAFAQAACAKKSKGSENYFLGKTTDSDPQIQLSCVGKISVESVKNGEVVIEKYSNLQSTLVSIQADADTDIRILGDVTYINLSGSTNWYEIEIHNTALTSLNCNNCTGLTSIDLSANTALTTLNCSICTGLTSIDLSANTALTTLDCASCTGLTSLDLSANTALTSLSCIGCQGLTSIDLSANTALTSLSCIGCENLTSIDLSANTALTSLSCSNCAGLTEIKYPASNDDVSTAIAQAITDATAADGTVYTDSAGAYYSTIETAATAKGWTIEQLS